MGRHVGAHHPDVTQKVVLRQAVFIVHEEIEVLADSSTPTTSRQRYQADRHEIENKQSNSLIRKCLRKGARRFGGTLGGSGS